ncbi:MAG TPA: hypothetical protein DEH78_32915 [Solibacterales bacterium]|nr:hypothetical protein [Bryobacterales bacterium]
MKQLSLFALSLSLSAVLHAQVAGRITGSVVDQTGAAVPAAKISLTLPGGSTPVLTTETTADGLFNIPTVRPDFYDLQVQASGFNKATLSRVKVDPTKETSLPAIRLDVSSTSETIEVRESTAAVQISASEVTTTISRAQVDSLPVLDRQVSNLFITQVGVSSARTATTINGLRPSYSNLLLDGVNIQDSVRTNPLDYVPNRLTIGQVADVTVASANVNPTVGGNANTISLTTPSGTNEFHGNAYWYNRNSYFAANDWFNNQSGIKRPQLNLNQLGASIGGPIVKDKLLFYSNYEAYRLKQQTPVTRTILTPEARRGIFRYRDAGGSVQSFNVLTNQQVQIDPFIQNLLSQVPEQSNFSGLGDGLNTAGYSFNARSNTTRDNITNKLDYYLSTRHTFSGSYIWNRDIIDRPTSGSFYTPEPPIFNDNNANFFSSGWRWSPTPTLTNELRGGFNRAHGTFNRRTDVPAFFVANNSNSLPLIFSSPINETMPEGRNTDTYSLQNNANWVKGRHTISFGFQATMMRTNLFGFNGIVPTYTLSVFSNNIQQGFGGGSIPGASATDINQANFLLGALGGLVSHSAQTFNAVDRTSGFAPGQEYRYFIDHDNYAPYISDTWKVRKGLTLVLGVRFEYFSPVRERNGLYIQPRTPSGNYIEALLGNPTIDFAGSDFYKRDWNNFAPNVGFAWDVFGNGRTALRGGYSIAYVNDNHINSSYNTFTVNNGLNTNVNATNLNGRVTGSLPAIAAPRFILPTTLQAEFNKTPSSAPVQGILHPEMRMPYTNQWNLGLEHEFKGFIFTARYVGNNTVGQLRQIDFNQININQGTFLQDFRAARNNGFLAQAATGRFDPRYNANISGSRPLPFFDSLPGGGFLTNAAISNPILSGEIGSLAQTYQANQIFPNGQPNFSFFPNRFALYSSVLANTARSNYNGAQFEVTKRMRNGMVLQANYAYSKALSTASAFRGIEAQLDNNNRSLEKARAPYDLTHAFKFNHLVPLPFGAGRRFNVDNRVINKMVSGWAFSGFLIMQSGNPVSVLSNRGTLNRGARSVGVNTATALVDGETLRNATGLFKNGNGVYWINPQHIGPDGRGVAPDGRPTFAGQLFAHPGPGEVGQLQRRWFNGPNFNNYSFSLQKDTKLTERQSIQFRADFYNLTNHPNFWPSSDLAGGDHQIQSQNFGRIVAMTSSTDGISSRVMQFGLFYRF